MDIFGARSKAEECRQIAEANDGERRAKLLDLAQEYDDIADKLVRLQAQQFSISPRNPVVKFLQN
jgi:hypothetical protein